MIIAGTAPHKDRLTALRGIVWGMIHPREGNTMDDYEDIINLGPPSDPSRPRLSMHQRAGLFSPFAALSGLDEVISDAGRLTEQKRELSEDEWIRLNETLSGIRDVICQRPLTEVVYFREDEDRAGGAYLTYRGRLREIDEIGRRLIFSDGTIIPFDDIAEIADQTQEQP